MWGRWVARLALTTVVNHQQGTVLNLQPVLNPKSYDGVDRGDWDANRGRAARAGGKTKGKVIVRGSVLAPLGGLGQKVDIGMGGRSYRAVGFWGGLNEMAEKAGWAVREWTGTRRAIQEARERGDEWVESLDGLNRG